jgi:DNA-binding NarL/FixJ family response regulator
MNELSSREMEIARLVARGLTNKEIAGRVGTTPASVRRSLENVFQKLVIRNRTMLAIQVMQWTA